MYDPLTTIVSVKAWMSITATADDAEIGALIPVASELIGRFCARENLGAVLPYTENYFGGGTGSGSMTPQPNFDVVLRHWPVVVLTQVMMKGATIPILSEMQLQNNAAGAFLQEDYESRILKFRYLYRSFPITVTYSAGYPQGRVPFPLQQAANQFCAEILRSPTWLGRKSTSILGENVSYDMGGELGMSNRVQAMLKPFINNIPFLGYG